MEKKYCPIHHLYYNGNECPMCCSERIANLERRFVKKEEKPIIKENKKKNKEISEASIEALMAKFNRR